MNSSFHYLVMAEQAMVQRALLARIKGSGLTLGQPKVLDYLKDHNGSSQKEIARGCHIEAGSLTSILNRMEEKGLVERRMLHGNRRNSYVFLTEKGEELRNLVTESFESIENEAFRGISEADRQQFMKTFSRIYENLTSKED
ncbi:MarR family transcriptional regulator [Eubacterium sp. An3]|uniref:MarR family winged helix-turn-helix transcriptional regulator n=1 Tax=Eubacterium sp. An3 TaxID=1965628 RepID=UPI000B3A9A72|nr:MarR family transcriptional regulator [Eubacterium sp. An3]